MPITPSQAAALGLVQGPTELLPVSSSAHLSLLPWLAGWDWDDMDPELRKSFEVALHAGTAAALLLGQRDTIAEELASFDRRRWGILLLSFLPPAAIGYAGERQIESRLGGPLATALGLLAGAAAMALADRFPQERGRGDAGWKDGLLLGVAQATALVPGVSRNGATLAAARSRRFTREHASMLSRTVALPIILGTALYRGIRLGRRGLAPAERTAFAVGTTASFASSVASQELIRLVERDRALWPYAGYRAALAVAVLVKLAAESAQRSSLERAIRATGGPVGGNGAGPATAGAVTGLESSGS